MRILLVRHTRVDVAPDIVYGATDVDVADTFQEEAVPIIEEVRNHRFDAVYSSPMVRCRKLAAACGYPLVQTDERLKELNFGKWELQRWEDIQDPLLEKWYADWIHIPAGGGESFIDQYNRVKSFLDEIKRKNFTEICLFVHGGVIRCARIYAGLSDYTQAFTFDIPHGSIHSFEI